MKAKVLIDERTSAWSDGDIKRLILKEGGLRDGQIIRVGMSNHCRQKGYHSYIDCDDTKLTDILDYLKTARPSSMGYWYILQSSPHKFSILNFQRISWRAYKRVLGTCLVVHREYVYCTVGKGYGVLRIGAKEGIVPRLLFRYGTDNGKECKLCRDDFFSILEVISVEKIRH